MSDTLKLIERKYGDWQAVSDDDPSLTDPDLSGGRIDWLHSQTETRKKIFIEEAQLILERVLPEDRELFLHAHYAWASENKAATWDKMLNVIRDLFELYKSSGIEGVNYFGEIAQKCSKNCRWPADRVDMVMDIGSRFLAKVLKVPSNLRLDILKNLVPRLLKSSLSHGMHFLFFGEICEVFPWDFSKKDENDILG